MVTIEENGITIEAETIKEAQKAYKKERARINKALDLANNYCFEKIGRTMLFSTSRHWFDTPKYDSFARDITIRGKDGEKAGTIKYYGLYPVSVMRRADGQDWMIKLLSNLESPGNTDIEGWYACAVIDGIVATQRCPEELNIMIEGWYKIYKEETA